MQTRFQNLAYKMVGISILLAPWVALAGGSDAGGGTRSVSVPATGVVVAAAFAATTLLIIRRYRR